MPLFSSYIQKEGCISGVCLVKNPICWKLSRGHLCVIWNLFPTKITLGMNDNDHKVKTNVAFDSVLGHSIP